MTDNQIQAGSSVESLCRKCKTVTDHHVVVMDGDKIVKVECKVCMGRHAYVSPKAEPKTEAKAKTPAAPRAPRSAGSSRSAAATSRQAQAQAEQWEKLVAPCVTPLDYSMERPFRAGDVVDHPVFGLGYVQKTIRPNTIEVFFKDSVRNMRCGKLS